MSLTVLYEKEMCGLTGQCVITAPEVFRFENDELVFEQHPEAALRPLVEHAVRLCPMQALALSATEDGDKG